MATTAAEAVDIAWRVGFPVVLKVASPDIVHKSEVGGVLLNLQSPDEVKAGFATVTANAQTAEPAARLDGVHVQHMITSGQEGDHRRGAQPAV